MIIPPYTVKTEGVMEILSHQKIKLTGMVAVLDSYCPQEEVLDCMLEIIYGLRDTLDLMCCTIGGVLGVDLRRLYECYSVAISTLRCNLSDLANNSGRDLILTLTIKSKTRNLIEELTNNLDKLIEQLNDKGDKND